ncbi:ABC transporter permease [Paenibacillus sp. J2TS4]|uniref:ABC transporter permease n=1 Tax=Paenibacillus sp. J2TS4 TaxID=2807194 RepID=UPI001B088E0F|nr:ABC transporter permease subunit [Paenibacillus sp. J2TS4]GIP35450.1 membrane protein [Paenibacillus sp. J2TS4]
MTQWLVLFNKEMVEMWRNGRWLWVPIVFIVLGAMQPLVTYYTPQLLENYGGLPAGTQIDIPLLSGGEIMVQTLSQFGILGLLILILVSMGAISSERQSGVAAIIMVRPVPAASWITAKWASLIVLMLVSLFLGLAAAGYYTEVLIGGIDPLRLFSSFLAYGLWLAFVITVTLFFSVIMKGNGGIAFLAVVVSAGLMMATGLLEKYMRWSPSRMGDYAGELLVSDALPSGLWLPLLSTFVIIVALLVSSTLIFRNQELLD